MHLWKKTKGFKIVEIIFVNLVFILKSIHYEISNYNY